MSQLSVRFSMMSRSCSEFRLASSKRSVATKKKRNQSACYLNKINIYLYIQMSRNKRKYSSRSYTRSKTKKRRSSKSFKKVKSRTKRKKTPSCVIKAAKRLRISKRKAQKSYGRGIGAWHTNPRSVRNIRGIKGGKGKKMSSQQWACARVNKLRKGGSYDQDLLR